MPQTVLIVDDHAGFRGFARRLLEAGGFTVVGEAEDGASALAAVEELRPELVLLDVVLPDTDGFAVAERLAQGGTGPVVVLTSSRDAADFGSRLERSSVQPASSTRTTLSGAALAALAAERPVSRRLHAVLLGLGALGAVLCRAHADLLSVGRQAEHRARRSSRRLSRSGCSGSSPAWSPGGNARRTARAH